MDSITLDELYPRFPYDQYMISGNMSDGNLSSSELTNISDSINRILNSSQSLNLDLISKFERNLRVQGTPLVVTLLVYSVLIVLGAVGNSLVMVAVIRNPAMRTARNVFIINLAGSDLILCLATTPLTIVELLSQYWPFGETPWLCKMVGCLQAMSIFLSVISITAIALDRYQVIVYPTKKSLSTRRAVCMVPVIWTSALLLAFPNILVRSLSHHQIDLPGLESIDFCYENWPIVHGRALYSIFVMLVQFFVPVLTVTISYCGIVQKLKHRVKFSSVRNKKIVGKEDARNKKTNILLMAIALIFCLSWLPFHVFNIIVDIENPFGDDTEKMLQVYTVCHMLGMSSACSNPVLYGWLNDNFKKEFLEIYWKVIPCRKQTEIHGSLVTAKKSGSGRSVVAFIRLRKDDPKSEKSVVEDSRLLGIKGPNSVSFEFVEEGSLLRKEKPNSLVEEVLHIEEKEPNCDTSVVEESHILEGEDAVSVENVVEDGCLIGKEEVKIEKSIVEEDLLLGKMKDKTNEVTQIGADLTNATEVHNELHTLV